MAGGAALVAVYGKHPLRGVEDRTVNGSSTNVEQVGPSRRRPISGREAPKITTRATISAAAQARIAFTGFAGSTPVSLESSP